MADLSHLLDHGNPLTDHRVAISVGLLAVVSVIVILKVPICILR